MRDLTLTPDLLLHAYASGIFPMAEARDDPDVFWVDPMYRGVIPLSGFHISRSLARRIRQGRYTTRIDNDFAGVIDACADRPETWINETIRDLYLALHDRACAHSVEVYLGEALVGGVYGVALGGAFFGESMFSRERDASKVALAYLVDRLREAGFLLFDVQFLTPHLQSLGAIEIPRETYRARLEEAVARDADFAGAGPVPDPQTLLQRMTQTS